MPRRGPAPPDRTKLLYENLFGSGDRSVALRRVSDGVSQILENAGPLLEDAELLADSKRYGRAEFLTATAREEMGKLYILVDMCRLDFVRHESILRALCKAFYKHEVKHAYFDLSAERYAGIRSLPAVKNAFQNETQLWWLGSYEDGEPDMPHDVYFYREANLYVDFDGYAEKWLVPNMPGKALFFEESSFLGTPVSKALKALEKLKNTRGIGLFEPEKLRVLNSHFSRQLIDEETDLSDLVFLYKAVGADLERSWGISFAQFEESEVHNWPLYSFL